MEIIYSDRSVIVVIKPAGILSTDEPGGLPELIRKELGDEHANVRTVHRLDRVVSGLVVLARSAKSASELSRQIREDEFHKEYVAVVHGECEECGIMRDLLARDPKERKTYVTDTPAKGVQEAVLDFTREWYTDGLSKVSINLHTGRTHQIRCQFSSRNLPLVGDRKYSTLDDNCDIALWSHMISFLHPYTGERMVFTHEPPDEYPWNINNSRGDAL